MSKVDVVMQVAFNMFIPCMLFTKVASTLSAQPDISLIAIPALALAQVCMAGLLCSGTECSDVIQLCIPAYA